MKEINDIEEESRPSNLIGTNNNSMISEANSLISGKNDPKRVNLTVEDQKK